jgi:1-acyl-sn-glycerol-3-phosphate acyltransferase
MVFALNINFRAFILLFVTLLWTALGIVIMIVNPTGRLYLWLAHLTWSRQLLWLGGLPLTVRGLENIDRKQSYVVCVNHQSLLDIPVLFAALPIPIRFLAKKSLFYIPIFGWSLWAAGFIPVDRNGGKKARDSLKHAASKIRNGRSVTVFPEGTRSPDGEIHEFKAGAFILAIESGSPVLPVVIKGTYEAAPKTVVCVFPHPIEVIVGAPVPTQGVDIKDRNVLQSSIRNTMIQMIGE